ncbi:MAG: signal recognition particle protein Srp19, partial [Hadesarchaea archaeon]|nr:signal recognition particle protein Srp19 [Hadesarchaea archaeon]
TLRDVYDQLEALSKMGPLKRLMEMIPGLGMAVPDEQLRVGEEKLKRFKVIMQSMTPEELEDPKLLNSSRIRRIALGSGTSEADVKELLRYYEMMRKLIKTVAKGRIPKVGPWGKLLRGMARDRMGPNHGGG